MNHPEYVLTTTGFLVMKSAYFDELTIDKIKNTSILNRSLFSNSDAEIEDYMKNNVIYHSGEAHSVFNEYKVKRTADEFFRMVDLFIDSICNIPFIEFIKLQAVNKNLSPIMFMFCMDLLTARFPERYHNYSSLPGVARLVPGKTVSDQAIEARGRTLKEHINLRGSNYGLTWDTILAAIIDEREAFMMLFKQVLVDTY